MVKNLVGKTLGGYKLDEIIGQGGMATVYKGYQTSLNRWVAVKVLYYQEATSLARFRLEARAIASLRHRNILIIYEYGEEDGLPYIAMEYIEGGTLENRLEGRPMDWRQVIELTIPIAEALYYAHQQNIIHRDVKPSNILMPQDGWPILADFGLVKHYDQESSLTQTGTFTGTPNYNAPEQARNLRIDFRVDMYSLGVVMFEMITGRVPFDHKVPNKVLLAHVMEPPPSPRKLNPDCPPELEEVILTMLKKQPEDRYADMDALIQALRTILRAYPLPKKLPVRQTSEISSGSLSQPPEPSSTKNFGRLFQPLQKFFGGASDVEEKATSEEQLTLPDDEETLRLDYNQASPQPAARIVFRDGSGIVIELPGNKKTLVLGRKHSSSAVDIDLEPYQASKYGVSRRHARLVNRGGDWWLDDLHSLNGTFVNDTEVKQGHPVALQDGDIIRLSQMSFLFSLSS